MQKNLKLKILIAVTSFITLVWLYRSSFSSNNENRKTGFLLKKHSSFLIKDYLLQPSRDICNDNPRLLIIVTSYAGHVELRSAHRRAMPAEVLATLNASRVFLLARIPRTDRIITQEAIKNENEIYGDILQGSFEEHYRNLTHKHLMGLRWASTECEHATFILKIDDDTVFRLDKTYKLLSKLKDFNKDELLIGYMLNDTRPRRERQNKWYVSWEEYGRTKYPHYLSGWYYITTPQVAYKLVEEALYHPYFWIDDVFITGILAEAIGLRLRHLPEGFWMEYYEQVECCIKNMRKNIRCDHAVGPNGNRNNLIVEFNKALDECDENANCKNNKDSEPPCVLEKDRAIFSDGTGVVEAVKF